MKNPFIPENMLFSVSINLYPSAPLNPGYAPLGRSLPKASPRMPTAKNGYRSLTTLPLRGCDLPFIVLAPELLGACTRTKGRNLTEGLRGVRQGIAWFIVSRHLRFRVSGAYP